MTTPNLMIRGAMVGSTAVMGQGLRIKGPAGSPSLLAPLCTLVGSYAMDTIVPTHINATRKLVKGSISALVSSLTASIVREPSSNGVDLSKAILIACMGAGSYIVCSKMFGDE